MGFIIVNKLTKLEPFLSVKYVLRVRDSQRKKRFLYLDHVEDSTLYFLLSRYCDQCQSEVP